MPVGSFANAEPFLVRDFDVTPTTGDGLDDFGRVPIDGVLYFRARHPRRAADGPSPELDPTLSRDPLPFPHEIC
jgi:hypothetical protein